MSEGGRPESLFLREDVFEYTGDEPQPPDDSQRETPVAQIPAHLPTDLDPEAVADLLSNADGQIAELFGHMYQQMCELEQEKSLIESQLRQRRDTHLEDMETLGTEVEQQLQQERQRVEHEFRERERQLREGVDAELESVKSKLSQLESENDVLKQDIDQLQAERNHLREESEALARDNELLCESLNLTKDELSVSQDFAHDIRARQMQEQQDRERHIESLSKEALEEREELLAEIEKLREKSQQLEAEREELQAFRQYCSSVLINQSLSGSGDIINSAENLVSLLPARRSQADIEEDEFWTVDPPSSPTTPVHTPTRDTPRRRSHTSSIDDISLDEVQPPEPANDSQNEHLEDLDDGISAKEEKIFKIVFIGDASVGKTSFIQRFCQDSFQQGVASTVGIDFQLKQVRVGPGGAACTLQLWDTCGQEKFRALTKQYFRKADGVIVMYDLTNPRTFRSIRAWMEDVQDHAPSDACIMLVGNKSDLATTGPIPLTDPIGDKELIARNADVSYTEVSSASGHNVHQCMRQFAARLLQRHLERHDVSSSQLRLNLIGRDNSTRRGGSRCCGSARRK